MQVKCLKVSRPDSHGTLYCVYRMKGFSVEDEFDGAEVGERIVLELCEYTEEELAALPDFTGW